MLNSTAESGVAISETRVRRSRLIDASLDEVWGTLAAFDEIDRWVEQVEHSSYTTAIKRGPGAARRIQMGRLIVVETVTEWTPPRKLVYEITGLPTRFAQRVTNHWLLESRGIDTLVTLTSVVEPKPNKVGRLEAALLSRVMAKVSDKLLAGLVHYHATARHHVMA